MTLTDIEKKLLMLAMDSQADIGEMAVAATKFIRSLRTRFPSGVELIKALESGELPAAGAGEPVFATREAAQAAASAMNRGFGGFGAGAWGNIMREAQERGRQRAAQQQQQRQQTWEEFCRRVHEDDVRMPQ